MTKKLDFEIDANGCYICTSHKGGKQRGYETIRVKRNGFFTTMHRWLYTEMFGPIPDNLVVRHKCDNGICIRPDHLELGTKAQNSRDMVERGRNTNGPRILDEQKAKEIKDLLRFGMTQREIASYYGVKARTIGDINTGKRWTDENIERREAAAKRHEYIQAAPLEKEKNSIDLLVLV